MAAPYADENFPFPVVVALRAVGHDVLTVREDGRDNQKIPDSDVLARATALRRAVLTHNRTDYFRLHRADSAHCGVIACKEDLDFAAFAVRIRSALSSAADLTGQPIRINRPSQHRTP